jgi:hypothetical protein
MKKLVALLAVAVVSVVAVPGAQAALLNAPVPGNAYITHGGLDWAWAAPCPEPNALGCGNGRIDMIDLSYQSAFGWRLPTAVELIAAPLATDFIFAGANVPLGGVDPVSGASFLAVNGNLTGDAACAAPYFGTTYRHCDWQAGLGQPLGPWAGMTGALGIAEQLVVRRVPEPGTLAVLCTGLAALGLRRRRNRG